MTNVPSPTDNPKKQSDKTKTRQKFSISQRLRTDLGRSVGTGVVKRVLKAATFLLTAKQDINSEDEVALIRQALLRQIHPMIER